VPSLTVGIFSAVYNASPALKSKSGDKKKKYVEPRCKFQKKRIMHEFTQKDSRFFDGIMTWYHDNAQYRIFENFETFLRGVATVFADFGKALGTLTPSDYEIDPLGEAVRGTLRSMLPELRDKAASLQEILPQGEIDNEGSNVVDVAANDTDLSFKIKKIGVLRAPV
jgi:hypothetical protein